MPRAARAASSEDGLIAILTSTASVADKDAACRSLKTVGTEKSVPALAALLTNEKLAHPARFALESMPYASAGAALREAVGKTKGLIRSGMIDSLGERRDASAVPIIAPALNDSDERVVAAAAWALGKIGTKDAAAALRAAHSKASGKRRAKIGQSLVLCANNLLKAVKRQEVTEIFAELAFDESKTVRFAALAVGIRAAGSSRADTVLRCLTDDDALVRAAGAAALPALSTEELCTVAADLKGVPTTSQIAVLSAVRIRGDRKLLPAVLNALKSDNDAVRIAAIRALGSVGDVSALPPLVQCAAKKGEVGKAARESIALLKGRDIDAKIIAFLTGEKDPERRVAWIDVLAFRRPAGAVQVLSAEALHADPIVRGHAMTALAQVAAPSDLSGVIAGVLAARSGAERDAAERAVVLLLAPVKPAAQRGAGVGGHRRFAGRPLAAASAGCPLRRTRRAGASESGPWQRRRESSRSWTSRPLQLAQCLGRRRVAATDRRRQRSGAANDGFAGLYSRRLDARAGKQCAKKGRRAACRLEKGDGPRSAGRGAGVHPPAGWRDSHAGFAQVRAALRRSARSGRAGLRSGGRAGAS